MHVLKFVLLKIIEVPNFAGSRDKVFRIPDTEASQRGNKRTYVLINKIGANFFVNEITYKLI